MLFQEPKVEFIQINLTVDTTSTSQAGVETCTGPEAPSNLCNYNGVMWLDEHGNPYYP